MMDGKAKVVRDVGVLAVGGGVGQLVTFLGYLLLARLVSPAEFGTFSVLASAIAILGVIAALKLEVAILLPTDEDQAEMLKRGAQWITVAAGGLVGLVGVFGAPIWAEAVGSPETIRLWGFVGIGVTFFGLYQVAVYWQTRRGAYGKLALAQGVRAVAIVGGQVIGVLSGLWAPLALVAGRVGGEVAGWLFLERGDRARGASGTRRGDFAALVRRYKSFPMFLAPQALLNAVSQNIPVLILAGMAGQEPAGAFALGARLFQMPVGLVKKSVTQVLLGRLRKLGTDVTGNYGKYIQASGVLLAMSVVGAVVVFATARNVILLLLGAGWSQAAAMAPWLGAWVVLALANAPAVTALQVLERQHVLLLYDICLLMLRLGALVIGLRVDGTLGAIILFSIVGGGMNVLLLLYTTLMVRGLRSREVAAA